ncbi:unnamed protein product [marine sediment metagenome]|uniref:FCP1 homology domain-containing protein n=1 Tax=marine sediment metagenome TaxID=412755 RepID=X1AFA9_9ZZZZ
MYHSDLDKIPEKPLTNKCIVLDLDETLVHSCGESDIELLKQLQIYTDPSNYDLRERVYKITMEDVIHKKGTGEKTEMWGIARPNVREFLIHCFTYFKIVIIWSAGRKKYVHAIIDKIFQDLKRPHIIWTYDDLEKLPNNTLIKPLNKLIDEISGLKKHMSLENTFIVDDRVSVFSEPNPYNGILIPAYKPTFNVKNLRDDDNTLEQLSKWFMKSEVINCKDIRKLSKVNIFNY